MDYAALQDKANLLREAVVNMLVNAGSGHSAGPLGSADFWTALYFGGVLKYTPQSPWWEERDRVVVSCGHYAPIVYATLAEAGFFPKIELESLRQLGSRLQGHPHRLCNPNQPQQLPGIENSSGPLGQGISVAVGLALAAKIRKTTWHTFCFTSDGEQDEGQTWEGYMLAAKYKLHNLTFILDRNNIQIDGHTEEVMPLETLRNKLEAFGLHVLEVNGHDIGEIISSLNQAKAIFEKPTVIILHTIPGKGVEFMENNPVAWHGQAPKLQEGALALSEINKIRTLNGRIISEHQ